MSNHTDVAFEATQRGCVVAIGDAFFSFEQSLVKQVVQLGSVTYVPRAADVLLGVFAYQGSVLPLINLHKALDLPGMALPSDIAIVVEADMFTLAFNVDSVAGFYAYHPQALSAYEASTQPPFIKGSFPFLGSNQTQDVSVLEVSALMNAVSSDLLVI